MVEKLVPLLPTVQCFLIPRIHTQTYTHAASPSRVAPSWDQFEQLC